MQMIITERCPFYLPTAIFVRTKAKVRVSPKGWRTVFGRFADCKYYSHEDKSACQPQRLAHGLWKICRVQRYTIYLTSPNKSRRNIYKKNFKSPKTQDT